MPTNLFTTKAALLDTATDAADAGWRNRTGGVAEPVLTTTNPIEGTKSLLATKSATTGTLDVDNNIAFVEGVVGSTEYTFRYEARRLDEVGNMRASVEWFDASNAFISGATLTGSLTSVGTTGSTVVYRTGTSPATAAKARVIVRCEGMGAGSRFMVDRLSFHDGATTDYPAAADTTDPTVTVDTVHGTGPVDDIYASTGYDPDADILTVTGTVADDIAVDRVEVTVDGGAATPAAFPTSSTWSLGIDVSGWAAGQHAISAVAYDTAGNDSTPAAATVWHSPDGLYGAAVTPGDHLVPLVAEGYDPAAAATAAPTGWESYTPLDVSAGGEFFLDNATDYKIVAQTVTGDTLRLRGGRNIVIIGMDRTVAAGWGTGETKYGIEFRDEIAGGSSGASGMTDGRIIHVEGVHLQGATMGQGFLLNCGSAHVQLINVRVGDEATPLRYRNCDERDGTNGLTTNHPDIIQAHSGFGGRVYGWKSLTIDGMTAYSGYQGIFLKQETNAALGDVTMRRVDLHAAEFAWDSELDAAVGGSYYGGAMMWVTATYPSTSDVTFGDSVWMEHHPNSLIQAGNYVSRGRYWDGAAYVAESAAGGVFTDLFQPPATVTTGSDGTGTYAEYPQANVTGKVYSGDPPGGEHVPSASVGAGYTP